MPVFLKWGFPPDDRAIVKALSDDQVIIAGSDTVPGYLTVSTQKGIARLNELKRRIEKPYIMLVGSIDQAFRFIQPDKNIERLAKKFWPGPLTIIGQATAAAPACAVTLAGTIAVRVPLHAGLLAMLRQFDGLLSTSANRSGMPTPLSMNQVNPILFDEVPYVVANPPAWNSTLQSTIVDCSSGGIVIVREGAIKGNEILKC